MSPKKLYYVLLGTVIALSLGVIGVGYGADKLLTSKANELSKLKAQAQVAEELQSSLTKNKADIKRYEQLNLIAKTIVPQDKDQSQATREIVKLANDSGISKLTSVTFPASDLGAVGKNATGAVSQATPVKGISGVYLIPITVSVDQSVAVPYDRFIAFLTKLEQNRRTAQISDISIKPDSKNPNMVAFTLVINEYIKP
jgi:hypothetical protein